MHLATLATLVPGRLLLPPQPVFLVWQGHFQVLFRRLRMSALVVPRTLGRRTRQRLVQNALQVLVPRLGLSRSQVVSGLVARPMTPALST